MRVQAVRQNPCNMSLGPPPSPSLYRFKGKGGNRARLVVVAVKFGYLLISVSKYKSYKEVAPLLPMSLFPFLKNHLPPAYCLLPTPLLLMYILAVTHRERPQSRL